MKTYILWGKGTYWAKHSTSSVANMKRQGSNKDGSTVLYIRKKCRNATIKMALDLVKILRLVWRQLSAWLHLLSSSARQKEGYLTSYPRVTSGVRGFQHAVHWYGCYTMELCECVQSLTKTTHCPTQKSHSAQTVSHSIKRSGVHMVSNTGVDVGLTLLPLGLSVEDKIQGTQRLRNLSRLYVWEVQSKHKPSFKLWVYEQVSVHVESCTRTVCLLTPSLWLFPSFFPPVWAAKY